MPFEQTDFTREALDYSVRISSGIENLDGLFKSGKFKEPETNRTLVALLVVTRKMLDEESRHLLGDLTDLLNSGGLVVSAIRSDGDRTDSDEIDQPEPDECQSTKSY